MYVYDSSKLQATIIFRVENYISSEEKSVKEKFQEYGLDIKPILVRSGDTDIYEIEANNWQSKFQYLSIYLKEYVHPESVQNFTKFSQELVYAYDQLNDEEKNVCEKFHVTIIELQRNKYIQLEKFNYSLRKFQKIFIPTVMQEYFNLGGFKAAEKDPTLLQKLFDEIEYEPNTIENNLKWLVTGIEKLAVDGTQLYEHCVQEAKKLCGTYNDLAVRVCIQLEKKPNRDLKDISLPSYISAKKTFKELYSNDKKLAFKLIKGEDIDTLIANVFMLLEEILKNKLLYRPSEFDVLCHKYRSFPSPLIKIMRKDKLSESKKYELIACLAQQTPLNSQVKNIDIETSFHSGNYVVTPLMYAAGHASFGIVQLLWEKGGQINGYALHQAIERDDASMVKFFLEKGADANAKDSQGCPALYKIKSYACAALLLSYNADPNLTDENGNTLLHRLAKKKFHKNTSHAEKLTEENVLALITLLLSKGAKINQKNLNAYTPLHFAVQLGIDSSSRLYSHARIKIKLFCENGANVNLVTEVNSSNAYDSYKLNPTPHMTPLLALFDERNLDWEGKENLQWRRWNIAQIFLDLGANIKVRDANGKTILHKLIEGEQFEALGVFLKREDVKNILDCDSPEILNDHPRLLERWQEQLLQDLLVGVQLSKNHSSLWQHKLSQPQAAYTDVVVHSYRG